MDSNKTSTLDNFSLEDSLIITEISGDISDRLLDMGLVPGTLLCIIKKIPLSNTIIIKVRGYELGLRDNEARLISVKKIENTSSCANCRSKCY